LISPRLLSAYRATEYRVGGITLRIGRASSRLDALLARIHTRGAVLITACNPRSRRMPARWNERAMARLAALLRNRTILLAQSGQGAWQEQQFLVVGAVAWAARLARRFGQNAIVLLVRGRPPALRLAAA
jgi:hypothetical protein